MTLAEGDMTRRPCSIPGVDSITRRRCILLDRHDGLCRVDTPLAGSSEWDDPWWKDYLDA